MRIPKINENDITICNGILSSENQPNVIQVNDPIELPQNGSASKTLIQSNHYGLPVLISEAIFACYNQMQAPLPLITASALCAVAAAVQRFIDVETPYGSLIPSSMNFITLADSGERKTAVDSIFNKPFVEHDKQQLTSYSESLIQYDINNDIWKTKLSILKRKYMKACRSSDNESITKISEELDALNKLKPKNPTLKLILSNDATISALIETLASTKSVYFSSAEGQMILSKINSQTLPLLNAAWSGEPLRIQRTSGSRDTCVFGARLSINIVVQPSFFEKMVKKGDGAAMESGFLSRAFICQPGSSQGFRMSTRPSSQEEMACINLFHQRIVSLIGQNLDDSKERAVLRLSMEARREWEVFHHKVETELGQGRYLSDIRSFGAKICENVLRLAACIEYFCNESTTIHVQAVQSAIAISSDYVTEFKRLFGHKTPEMQMRDEANKMYQWLFLNVRSLNSTCVPITYLYQRGPKSLRPKHLCFMSLQYLINLNAIWIGVDDKGSQFCNLNSSHPIWNPPNQNCPYDTI